MIHCQVSEPHEMATSERFSATASPGWWDIEFEDKGQDTLRFLCDNHGRIIESQPYHTNIWNKFEVVNIQKLHIGHCPWLRDIYKGNHALLKFRYPIISIRRVGND